MWEREGAKLARPTADDYTRYTGSTTTPAPRPDRDQSPGQRHRLCLQTRLGLESIPTRAESAGRDEPFEFNDDFRWPTTRGPHIESRRSSRNERNSMSATAPPESRVQDGTVRLRHGWRPPKKQRRRVRDTSHRRSRGESTETFGERGHAVTGVSLSLDARRTPATQHNADPRPSLSLSLSLYSSSQTKRKTPSS